MEQTRKLIDRREFALKLGLGAGVAALAGQALASLRALVPNVSYDAPTVLKIGLPADFPDGMKFLPDERLFVFRDGQTFHAISAVCTHLGCTVRAEAQTQIQPADSGSKKPPLSYRFLCPCHGSKYKGDGSNESGPAPAPLPWYHLSVAEDDGQLVADLARTVSHDFRLTLGQDTQGD